MAALASRLAAQVPVVPQQVVRQPVPTDPSICPDCRQWNADHAGGTSWSWRACEGSDCLDFVYADSQTPVSNDHAQACRRYAANARRALAARLAREKGR